ncbi:MAG: RimK family alpha-L-glutamate ligase [Sphaerochaeta associata]|uniref:RimK family alpha-L-glutamate ligase n=1 Tax=Sphaerochaeta associata TaxID=1129264 RepID=UPI002B1F082D|nr:RimK family alpha-L-glutamate ligase [Sphaerochaeta associata]MEA5108717.1 RimK family alpha-L-glutamate ligase [Sphaerochaeta associata]
MRTQLWLLYEKQFDVGLSPIPWSMARHCGPYGVSFDILFIEYFSIIEDELYYKGVASPTPPFNVFFRGYDLQLSRWFEKRGIRVINSSNAMASCKDKWATYKLVLETNIPQPLTIVSKPTHSFSQVSSIVGSPFIAKDRYGMKGQGVYLIDSETMFDSLQPITGDFSNYLFQEYVSSSHGKDCRVYIAGDTIIGAILRNNQNDFRANISQGGTFSDYPISAALREASLEISRVLGAEVVAIDFLFGENGFVFCEANTNAGFHSFNKLGYQTTSVIMDYICNKVVLV